MKMQCTKRTKSSDSNEAEGPFLWDLGLISFTVTIRPASDSMKGWVNVANCI